MENFLGRISRNMLNAAGLFLGISRRIDYERLSWYILEIGRTRDLEALMRQTSLCLRDILNYRLFGFAIQHEDAFDAWVDPKNYDFALRKMIEKDFNISGKFDIRRTGTDGTWYDTPIAFDGDSLDSHVIAGDMFLARLYLVPGRRILGHHTNIVTLVLNALGAAISNLMSIKKLQNEAALDELTECYNRHEFKRLIEHDIANSQRHNHELSVIMFDIDLFKKVNDTNGHKAGDRVLKAVAELVRSSIRKGDYITRYGGEEFIVALPDTGLASAVKLAERLRISIENHEIKILEGRKIKVSASFGVSTLRSSSTRESLIEDADDMLYRAKSGGRNIVMPAPDMSVPKLHVVASRPSLSFAH